MKQFPIIDKLGGRDVVYEHLREVCGITTRRALGMWATRENIPGKPLRALIELAAAKGITVVPEDLRVQECAEKTPDGGSRRGQVGTTI